MARKKAGRTGKRPARKAARRSASTAILSDRFPPVDNCHVVVRGDPPYGTCEEGGGGRCTFPSVKIGARTTQMILCECDGKAQLVIHDPKARPTRPPM